MPPKRRLDERRKLQNREAQRRFRERAKQKIGIQKNDSSKGITKKSEEDDVEDKHSRLVKAFTQSTKEKEEKRQSFDSIYSSASSSSSSSSTNSTLSSQQTNENILVGSEILQSALMTSLSNLSQEMDRCDKEEILKNLKIPSSTIITSQSNPTTNNLVFLDSNTPSDSSSSFESSSNRSNHSITTAQWLGLPTSFESSTIGGGEEYLTTITTSPPISSTIINSNNFIQQPSIDNWSQMIEQSVDFPSFPYFEQNQFQQNQQQQSCLFNLPLIEPTLQQREQQQQSTNFTCNDEIEKWKKSMTNETFNRFFNGLV